MTRYDESTFRGSADKPCHPLDTCPMCNPRPAAEAFDWELLATLGERPELSAKSLVRGG